MIQWSKDLGRSIDYLATRDDIDMKKIGYFGLSLGAWCGPIMCVLEPRIRTSVLLAGGFDRTDLEGPPEISPIHFAPRLRIPTLMINGKNDFLYPLEDSQMPMFRLLGASEDSKRHVVFDGGHVPPPNEMIRETLDWLDRYLGPVETQR